MLFVVYLQYLVNQVKTFTLQYSGIVDYQWRRMKINEELLSLDYPLI